MKLTLFVALFLASALHAKTDKADKPDTSKTNKVDSAKLERKAERQENKIIISSRAKGNANTPYTKESEYRLMFHNNRKAKKAK